ncbi:hypothetical protein [Kitasatospora sp. NPDC058046]|uniref:DUF7848 domain-containing protein n=1 Tax=Kitasatospora sp. NPDC058046 TaxID=3346312 RepID=UPI0036DB9BF7
MGDTPVGPVFQAVDGPLPVPCAEVPGTRLRRAWRFMDWTLSHTADEPDTPPVMHRYRCVSEEEDGTVCGAAGPEAEDFTLAQAWPFLHARQSPEHRSFEHVARVPWALSVRPPAGRALP